MEKIYSEIGRAIMSYDKQFKAYMKKELASENLNVAEAMTLMTLYEEDGQTQEQLLQSLHYDKSVMTRTIQSLEKSELIERQENPEDARSWLLYLTASGIEVKPRILCVLRSWCSIAFSGMSGDKTEILLETLGIMSKNIRESE